MSAYDSQRDLPENPVLNGAYRALYAIRGSFLVFVFSVGLVWLAAAVVLQEGVMAGMLGIWGISAMLYAVIAKFGLQLIGYSG